MRRPPDWRNDPATNRNEWPERLPHVVHPTQASKYALWRRNVPLGEAFTPAVLKARHRRITQWVEDFATAPVDRLRVLDLACRDAGFSIELAKRGAEVVGIEGRSENLAPALPVAEQLPNLKLVTGDVRELVDAYGEFDVVLCLGILYHLQAEEVFDLLLRLARVCRRLAVIETQVSLTPRRVVHHQGRDYWGADYPEDTARPGAALDKPDSFWPTKPSLLNLLSQAGFRSVAELLNPTIPVLAAFADHVALVAVKNDPEASTSPR